MTRNTKKSGKVFLVGAGPGDPGLITVKGLDVLRAAGAVVYDALVNPFLLGMSQAPQKIDAGKRHGEKSLPQEAINALLVRLAREGKKVVRLKGGDPFVFGRGGEEIEALRKARIAYEIVPGVSAGHAVPAYAGIPVTDRRWASQVTFVTGHEDPSKPQTSLNWKALAGNTGTLVFFMGVGNLDRVCERLIREGCSPQKPAAVIEWGTLPGQKTVEGNVSNLAGKVRKAKLQTPALTVIGDVVRFRRKFDWFRPGKSEAKLSGRTVVVTRPKAQASSLKEMLLGQGAEVLEFPSIGVLPPKSWKPLDDAVRYLRRFDWLVFTSVNGVRAFIERLEKSGNDMRALAHLKIAAIGETTAETLRRAGLKADFVPKKFTSENLVKELAARFPVKGMRFLLPRTDIAPEKMCGDLRSRGARITQVMAYRTVKGAEGRHKKALQRALRSKKMDFVTFTSASTVTNFFESLSKAERRQLKRAGAKMVSIGPVTSETLQRYGFKPYREAKRHTVEGLLEALIHE